MRQRTVCPSGSSTRICGTAGGLVASPVAFTPSFCFILFGARHLDRLGADQRVRAFLYGTGPAAIGAILGSAVPSHWPSANPLQYAVLALRLPRDRWRRVLSEDQPSEVDG